MGHQSFTVVDLFAGCGGLTQGLSDAGLEVIAGYDNWQPAVDVYAANFDHPATILSIDTSLAKSLKKLQPTMIAGGPPCQDFSSAGKQNSAGKQADMTRVFADLVVAVKPAWILMENVPRAQHAGVYQAAVATIGAAGYTTALIVLDASLYGVPQKRKRLFMIASRTHDANEVVTLLQAAASEQPTSVRDYVGSSFGLEHYYRHPRNYDRRGIFSIDEPAATIRGVNRPLPAGYPGHHLDSTSKDGVRALTTAERARIQTFPSDFKWTGSKTALEQMIGNAVPPHLAQAVGAAIRQVNQSTS